MCWAKAVPDAQVAAYSYLGAMLVGGVITVFDARRPSRQEAYAKVLATPSDHGTLKRLGISRPMGAALAVPHGVKEAVLTIIGVALVSLGHILNLRHVHSAACKERAGD